MKKFTLALPVIAIALAGCSEKDQAYYLKNIDKAEEKIESCKADLKKAFKDLDKEKANAIKQDKECQAAKDAIEEHKKIQREKNIQAAKEKLNAELGKLSWQEMATHFVNSECSKKWFLQDSDDFACIAELNIYQEKAEQGKAELAKLEFNALLAEEKNYCARDKRKYSTCEIWQSALDEVGQKHFQQTPYPELEKQQETYCAYDSKLRAACSSYREVSQAKEKEIIENYVKNYDQLKQDYNQCVTKIKQIGDHYSRYKERDAITNFYPCEQAQDARSKLGLPYDDFKTLMD